MNIATLAFERESLSPRMATVEPPLRPATAGPLKAGPVTSSRLRRTATIYGLMAAVGLIALFSPVSAGIKAAGVGLWFPGGGFLADGGWAVLLTPVTLVLFLLSVFAWFGAGAVLAPVLVWLGSAALSMALAGPQIWTPGPAVVALLAVGTLAENRRRIRIRDVKNAATRVRRAAVLPAAQTQLAARTAAVPDTGVGELDAEGLASVRYLYDRALQPVGVDGRPDLSFRADGGGRAELKVELNGRTPLHIRPAA